MNYIYSHMNPGERPHAWADVLPVGVYACDANGHIMEFNAKAGELWGRKPATNEPDERFCGSHRLYTLDGSPLPHADTPMAKALATDRPFRDERVVIERPDGTRIIALVNIDPLHDDKGELVGAVNCFQDITELENARSQMAEERQVFKEILNALPAAVYTTDADGNLTFFNEAASDFAGKQPRLGDDRWCVTEKLRTPDGEDLAFEDCPMGVALREQRPLRGAEAVAVRPDGSEAPFLAYPTPLFNADGSLRGAVNMLIDISDLKRAEDEQRLLLHELSHRVKNTLAVVQSVARQTLHHAATPDDFVTSFTGRVEALAAAHSLLTRSNWRGVRFSDLVTGQLALRDDEHNRITLDGPEFEIGPQHSISLSLVLHELGANARKYGALSSAEGRVQVTWSVDDVKPPRLSLTWRETGGPTVRQPERRGFGSVLIEQGLRGKGGDAQLHFNPEGVTCQLDLPLTPEGEFALAPADLKPRSASRSSDETSLPGLRVLLFEDEAIVLLDLEGVVSEAGMTVTGSASDIASALELARSGHGDVALLDANLHGHPVDGVADALAARGIPFAFATGYGRDALPRQHRSAPVLSKPFNREDVLDTLMLLFENSET
ncbi:HWE histidine kinase domain-containing protein [Maricaulis sp. CAU 1757]